jgi:ABC-type transport system substrate-binding protein/signal transduction histidine kinase
LRHKHLELAVFSVDPPSLDMLHGLDPESFLIVSAIADPLVYIDAAGEVKPALALSWTQTSPVHWRFVLRQGVLFHDGRPLDADDFVATFAEHLNPEQPTVLGRSAFSLIKACRKLSPYEIEFETLAPDNMLLRRMCFSHVYSRAALESGGREAVRQNPGATGAFRLERWTKGVEIVLRRNAEHWRGSAGVDSVRIPIIRQKNWVAALRSGEIDVALGIDVHDKVRLQGAPNIQTFSADAAISHFFLLKHRGPLANLRVRQALNHAVHKQLIVDIAEHGYGRPQRSIATPGTFGYAEDVEPYVYNPELARRILAEEGYAGGFTLRGVVSETSTAVYQVVKEFLARIDVRLEADVMPRAEWMAAVRGPKLRGEGDYAGDFALFVLDNPLLHSAFHQFVFLFTGGDWTLVHDPDFDQRFLHAATVTGDGAEDALRDLERHVAKNAMLLFTAQAAVHAAARTGIRFSLPKTGHFDTDFWWHLDCSGEVRTAANPPAALAESQPGPMSDYARLLQATSHLGMLYLPPDTTFEKLDAERVWEHLDATQQRWEIQLRPLIRELVSQAETKMHLANVLDSTERVAICGIGDDGRELFINEGYRQMLGQGVSAQEHLGAMWQQVTQRVREKGVWSGPVHVKNASGSAATELYLTATRARDAQHVPLGYTLVFSDFSGEEERIRNAAIRAILDNVPYGLLRCARDGSVMPGYSAACRELLPGARGRTIEGSHFVELLGASERDAYQLRILYEQLVEDLLPEELNVAQFERRIEVQGRFFALSPAPLRDADGTISAVLFSIFDETERIAAQRNQDYLRAVMNILKHRGAFGAFVREMAATSASLITSSAEADPIWQAMARRFVHTCKGGLGQFGLSLAAARLHALEEVERLSVDTLEQVREILRAQLAEQADVWRVSLDDCEPEHVLRSADFERLQRRISGASSLEVAREIVEGWCDERQRKPVAELLGPIANSCGQHAERRGKRAKLVLSGGEVTLPPRQWAIAGALAHLVRNAVDHGLEYPEARGEKAPDAEVRVVFEETAAHIRCTVSDDGRGIDVTQLVERAARSGLLEPEHATRLSREDALRLVFLDGLSCAGSVSDSSGRGVGMSAVKSAMEALGGSIDIRSEPGRGTDFELRWPRLTSFSGRD